MTRVLKRDCLDTVSSISKKRKREKRKLDESLFYFSSSYFFTVLMSFVVAWTFSSGKEVRLCRKRTLLWKRRRRRFSCCWCRLRCCNWRLTAFWTWPWLLVLLQSCLGRASHGNKCVLHFQSSCGWFIQRRRMRCRWNLKRVRLGNPRLSGIFRLFFFFGAGYARCSYPLFVCCVITSDSKTDRNLAAFFYYFFFYLLTFFRFSKKGKL